MVIDNFPKTSLLQGATHYRLAFIYDRMAAFVLDFAVVFTIHSTISFAFKREQSLAMIEGYHIAFIFWLLVNVSLFFITYFAYYFFSLQKFKTTVGKYVFKIQVKNIWGLAETQTRQNLLYALWKTLGLITLGFTFIGAFTDDKRRTLHEKMSDTILVTKKQRYSPAPTAKEKQFFNGLLLPAQFLLLLVVLYGFSLVYKTAQKEILDAKIGVNLQPKCEWVEEEFKNTKESNRMAFSLALFLLSEIDRNCLEQEARSAFESGTSLEEANMAFALLYPEDKQAYLKEACNVTPGSFSCYNSTHTKALYRLPYQVLWQALEAFEETKYDVSLSLLNQIKDSYYKPKIGYLKFKNLWKLNPLQMQAGVTTFADLIDEVTYDKVIAWACLDSTTSTCDNEPSFCKKILNKTDFSTADLEEELSYVRLRECHKQWDSELPTQFSEVAANLFYAKWRLAKHKDLRILRDLMADDSIPFMIKGEIAQTMFRHGDLNKEDRQMVSRFMQRVMQPTAPSIASPTTQPNLQDRQPASQGD